MILKTIHKYLAFVIPVRISVQRMNHPYADVELTGQAREAEVELAKALNERTNLILEYIDVSRNMAIRSFGTISYARNKERLEEIRRALQVEVPEGEGSLQEINKAVENQDRATRPRV